MVRMMLKTFSINIFRFIDLSKLAQKGQSSGTKRILCHSGQVHVDNGGMLPGNYLLSELEQLWGVLDMKSLEFNIV